MDGAVDECCDPAIDAVEFTRSCRVGGGSLPCCLSLLLPLPVPLDCPPFGVALLLELPCRNLGGSSLGRLAAS